MDLLACVKYRLPDIPTVFSMFQIIKDTQQTYAGGCEPVKKGFSVIQLWMSTGTIQYAPSTSSFPSGRPGDIVQLFGGNIAGAGKEPFYLMNWHYVYMNPILVGAEHSINFHFHCGLSPDHGTVEEFAALSGSLCIGNIHIIPTTAVFRAIPVLLATYSTSTAGNYHVASVPVEGVADKTVPSHPIFHDFIPFRQ